MKYRIGQKVVYIGPDFRSQPRILYHGAAAPTPKAIYTIRGGRHITCCGFSTNAYLIEEIRNRSYPCICASGVCELHVNEGWLRPVTDISQFHEIRKAVEGGVHLRFPESVE